MNLTFEIQFLSDWHCGSGLGAGAESDAEMIKDENGLPYIPGKTIKGLLRDALDEIRHFDEEVSIDVIQTIFGAAATKNIGSKKGKAFFSNAILPINEQHDLASHELTPFLYRNIASTSIEKETGVAKNKSLRTMEVCVPLKLIGFISGVDENEIEHIKKAALWIRSLGVNRNRGLGRCQFVFHQQNN